MIFFLPFEAKQQPPVDSSSSLLTGHPDKPTGRPLFPLPSPTKPNRSSPPAWSPASLSAAPHEFASQSTHRLLSQPSTATATDHQESPPSPRAPPSSPQHSQ
uniref:Uncharacterized protein n=1 Tax=Populus davidiana TaxID=266767 RepID=A0A6M2EF97_9ROSI